jgi:hypothetical protein
MNAALVAAAGISALAFLMFLLESEGLSQIHARVRVQVLNAARWGIVVALVWTVIPATFSQPADERIATTVGLIALVGVLMLVPVRWFVRVGGRDPRWDLRRVKVAVSRMANQIRHSPGKVPPERINEAMARLRELRSDATAELCDLLMAELQDLQAGAESWNEAGRRSIRIDALSRHLWPEDLPPPDNTPDESTLRWHLYREFGRLMELADAARSEAPAAAAESVATAAAEFSARLGALEQFRQSNTDVIIECVQASAAEWLDQGRRGRWIEPFDFIPLGIQGALEIKRLWGRDAAMWGAHLDDEDLKAIRLDLDVRFSSGETKPARESAAAADGDSAVSEAAQEPAGGASGSVPDAPEPQAPGDGTS